VSSPIGTLISIAPAQNEAAVAEPNLDEAFLALLAQVMPATAEGAGFLVPGAEAPVVAPVELELTPELAAEISSGFAPAPFYAPAPAPMPVEFIPRNGSVFVAARPSAATATTAAPAVPALPAESAPSEGSTFLTQRPGKAAPSPRARINRIAYQRPVVTAPKINGVAKPETTSVAIPEAPMAPAVVVHPVPQVMPPRVVDAAPAAPVAETPAVETPLVNAPVVNAPVIDQPVVKFPKTHEAPRAQGIPQGTPHMNAEVVATTPAAMRSPAIRAALLILESMQAGEGSGDRVPGSGVVPPELPVSEAPAPEMNTLPADVRVTELIVPESTLKQEAPKPKEAASRKAEQPAAAQSAAPQAATAGAGEPTIAMRVMREPVTPQDTAAKPAARESSAPAKDIPAPAVRVEAPAKPARQEHGFERAPKRPPLRPRPITPRTPPPLPA
jgi:hypothetical protein